MSKYRNKLLAAVAPLAALALVFSGCGQRTAPVSIEKPEDLADLRVGVQVGTTAEESANEFLKTTEFKLTTYDQIIQPFSELKTGRIDAIIVDEVVAKYYVATDPESYKVTGARLTNEPIGICFKKGNEALRDKFEQVMAELREEGKLKEISEKWFGEDLVTNVEGISDDTSERGSVPAGMTVLKVGVDDSYPPMEFRDEKNEISGFDIDLARAVGEKLNLKVEFVSTAWDGIFSSLNIDKFDCIISSVSINEERQENFALTTPYIANAQVIVIAPEK